MARRLSLIALMIAATGLWQRAAAQQGSPAVPGPASSQGQGAGQSSPEVPGPASSQGQRSADTPRGQSSQGAPEVPGPASSRGEYGTQYGVQPPPTNCPAFALTDGDVQALHSFVVERLKRRGQDVRAFDESSPGCNADRWRYYTSVLSRLATQ